jgi:hypothetical protein
LLTASDDGNQQTRISTFHVGFADRVRGSSSQQTRISTSHVGFVDRVRGSSSQQTRISTFNVGFADRAYGGRQSMAARLALIRLPLNAGMSKTGAPMHVFAARLSQIAGLSKADPSRVSEIAGLSKNLARKCGMSKNLERNAFDIPAFSDTGGRFPCKTGPVFDKPAFSDKEAGSR